MNKKQRKQALKISVVIIVFILGWFLNSLIGFTGIHEEKPFSGLSEKDSPYDRLSETDLELSERRLVVHHSGIVLASYTDTNSMDPLLDDKSTGIEIIPEKEDEIRTGDVVSYESDEGLIPHRVISTGYDTQGWYALVKGDNSKEIEKIRFNQVRYVLIGVLY